jgi:hypothetical protein
MSNQFSGIGNLGTDPVLHEVTVNGEERQVAEMRVYFDRSVPKENGEYRDEGGFWRTVSLWRARAGGRHSAGGILGRWGRSDAFRVAPDREPDRDRPGVYRIGHLPASIRTILDKDY